MLLDVNQVVMNNDKCVFAQLISFIDYFKFLRIGEDIGLVVEIGPKISKT